VVQSNNVYFDFFQIGLDTDKRYSLAITTMLKSLLLLVAFLIASSVEAQIYKCEAKYQKGLIVSIDLVIPTKVVPGFIAFAPLSGEAKPILGQHFVDTGLVAHDIPKTGSPTQATLIIKNRNPLIATFMDRYSAVSIRVDGKPPNARFTFYNASFIPDEVAFGTCT
jgi:hypothetical protein